MCISCVNQLSVAFTAAATMMLAAMPTSAQIINESHKLLATDRAQGDLFGHSINIDNGTVIVGSPRDSDNGFRSGAAYLFDATTGIELLKLLPNDGQAGDNFGECVDIDNGIAVVGANTDDNENGETSGSAYLFDSMTGQQLFRLIPNDGADSTFFGTSVSIDGNLVAVGASGFNPEAGSNSGAVYIFDVLTGIQIAKLFSSDLEASDFFGWEIALDNGTLAVGAWGNDAVGSSSGAVYLFDVSSGQQVAKLLPNDLESGDSFGRSISMSNGIVAIGSNQDTNDGERTGSAYLFDVTTGTQLVKLLADDREAFDNFGDSIAIINGTVVVGARDSDNPNSRSGAAYTFDVTTGTQISKLLPADRSSDDLFGYSIAMDNDSIVIGMPRDDEDGSNSGSAFLFDYPQECDADLTGDRILDFFDISAFLTAFTAQDPVADYQPDGNFDFFDVSAYLAAFAAGCP